MGKIIGSLRTPLSSKLKKMDRFTSGQLNENCDMVNTGCKPCSCMAMKSVYVDEAVAECEDVGLFTHSEFLCQDWETIWIYKREEMRDIITLLPVEPKTKLDHYLLGKVFGYSNDAILDFIGRKFDSKKEPKTSNPISTMSDGFNRILESTLKLIDEMDKVLKNK